MANFRPQATGYKTHYWSNSSEDYSTVGPVRKNTYRELKHEIKHMLLSDKASKVMVNRSRRGEWGEWFEEWVLQDSKPIIIKQGWM